MEEYSKLEKGHANLLPPPQGLGPDGVRIRTSAAAEPTPWMGRQISAAPSVVPAEYFLVHF